MNINEVDQLDNKSDSKAADNKMQKTRCGFVAVLGPPNAGKSTLINQLLGSKLAIVSRKVQTTRTRMLGIKQQNNTQIIFIDTPGIFKPSKRMERSMVGAAWQGALEADQILLIVDATKGFDQKAVKEILEELSEYKKNKNLKVSLLLNKIDLLKKEKLLALAQRFSDAFSFERIFMISAEKGEGTSDILAYLEQTLPEGPWHFLENELSDMPVKLIAAELTREKIFENLHDELPYEMAVETESWTENSNGSIKIEQIIYVKRDTQKMILLGKNGQQIKKIGQMAREAIGAFLGCKVHLYLFVKVRKDWEENPDFYKIWGLDYHA